MRAAKAVPVKRALARNGSALVDHILLPTAYCEPSNSSPAGRDRRMGDAVGDRAPSHGYGADFITFSIA